MTAIFRSLAESGPSPITLTPVALTSLGWSRRKLPTRYPERDLELGTISGPPIRCFSATILISYSLVTLYIAILPSRDGIAIVRSGCSTVISRSPSTFRGCVSGASTTPFGSKKIVNLRVQVSSNSGFFRAGDRGHHWPVTHPRCHHRLAA